MTHELLEREVLIQEEGYVFVYISNEHPTRVDVYFDDVEMTHTKTNIIQYNEYYPFGLQASTSWTRDGVVNNVLYNTPGEFNVASSYIETLFRTYDPTLGRFMQTDPLAYITPGLNAYQYALNNPILFNDPTGLLANPGFSDEVWSLIEAAWYSTPSGGIGHFEYSNGMLTDWATWSPGGGGGGGGGSFSSSPGFFYPNIDASSAYAVLRSLAYENSLPPKNNSPSSTTGPLQWQLSTGDLGLTLLRSVDFRETVTTTDWLQKRIDEVMPGRGVLHAGLSSIDINVMEGYFIAWEGVMFREEQRIVRLLKSNASTGQRHFLKNGLKNVRALGTTAGAFSVGLSWYEASQKDTAGAYSLATIDTIMVGVGFAFPVVGITYGLVRFGLDIAGVDLASGIDAGINYLGN